MWRVPRIDRSLRGALLIKMSVDIPTNYYRAATLRESSMWGELIEGSLSRFLRQCTTIYQGLKITIETWHQTLYTYASYVLSLGLCFSENYQNLNFLLPRGEGFQKILNLKFHGHKVNEGCRNNYSYNLYPQF